MTRPATEPIGLQLTRTAKVLSRALDDALATVGGTLPLWQVLVTVKARPGGNQREFAAAMGVEGPTLTHHLNRMERDGLVTRRRDPENRRAHVVALTDDGEAAFRRLRSAVAKFDGQLRTGIGDAEVAQLAGLLERLRANVVPSPAEVPA